MVGMTIKQTLLSPKQVPLSWCFFVSSADLEVVFLPLHLYALETHSLMVPDGYFYILSQFQWHENWNLSVNRLIHDSRGTVALLRQHPEEEFSLLIGFGGWRDDDVTTRRQGAAKNNLPTWWVMRAAADRTECTQVRRWQICILWLGLERQHTLIAHVHWKYKLLINDPTSLPATRFVSSLMLSASSCTSSTCLFLCSGAEAFSQIKAPIQQCKKSYI